MRNLISYYPDQKDKSIIIRGQVYCKLLPNSTKVSCSDIKEIGTCNSKTDRKQRGPEICEHLIKKDIQLLLMYKLKLDVLARCTRLNNKQEKLVNTHSRGHSPRGSSL